MEDLNEEKSNKDTKDDNKTIDNDKGKTDEDLDLEEQLKQLGIEV